MHRVDYGTESIMLFQPGRLRIEALRWALNEVVRRHDVLRACFAIVEGSPVQVIAAVLIVELKVEDLCALPQVERETSALRRARTEVQAPFDLERGPLLRVRVLRLDGKRERRCS